VLAINILGDTITAFIRYDWSTLIGLPIGGAMICYLFSIGSGVDRAAIERTGLTGVPKETFGQNASGRQTKRMRLHSCQAVSARKESAARATNRA
jgi:hypothetical protein